MNPFRSGRGGALPLLSLAVVLAVAALSAVSFFSDRISLALSREARQLLGADLVLAGSRPVAEKWRKQALAEGLAQVTTLTFPSMVAAKGRVQLAEIKVVGSGYPLRGKLHTSSQREIRGGPVDGSPQGGETWIGPRLADALGVAVGDRIQVGEKVLRVAAFLTFEADRGANLFGLAPRLLMNHEDLAETRLLGPGSRVRHRWLVAGEDEALTRLKVSMEGALAKGERLETVDDARPEIRQAFERGSRFLGLAALLTTVLAAVAIGVSARRHVEQRTRDWAILRCLGYTQAVLLRRELATLGGWVGLASALGVAVGWAAHFVLHEAFASLLGDGLPMPSWNPVWLGLAAGAVLAGGFALPAFLRLRGVPALRVLRRELGAPPPAFWPAFFAGGVALALLFGAVSGEVKLAAIAGGSLLGGFVVAVLLVRAGLGLLALLPGGGSLSVRRRLLRTPWQTALRMGTLMLGMTALILLSVTRGQLLDAWLDSVPADAPNRFIINIQPDQVRPVQDWLASHGVTAQLLPMVRGRLTAIGERAVTQDDYDDDRARRLVAREFNLSWAARLPPGNRVAQGRWLSGPGAAEASVELGLAETLGIRVGDRLTYQIGGMPVTVSVVGLRRLDWGSMQVNFFVLFPPGVLDDFPATHITSFHLPPGAAGLDAELVQHWPNLTLIDVAQVASQVQQLVGRIALAVQFVFVFALLGGGLVLVTTLAAEEGSRRRELALMRAMGARRRWLWRQLLHELVCIGAGAGLLATALGQICGAVLAQQLFNSVIGPVPWLWLAAPMAGAALAVGVGWRGVAASLRTPPMRVLQSE